MKRILVLCLAAAGCLLIAPTAIAATKYVATTGSDTYDCSTEALACASFNRAYRMAALGDTVIVNGGTYPPQNVAPMTGRTSDTDQADVVFQPAMGEIVTVNCNAAGYNCLAVEGHHVTYKNMRSATLTDVNGMPRQGGVCICRGSYDVTWVDIDAGDLYIAGDEVTVTGGDFGPTVDAVSKIERGDDGPSENIVIEGAYFHDHRRYEDHIECIAAYSGENVDIRNNRFDDCEVFSIFLAPGFGETGNNYTIENNIFTNTSAVAMSAHIKTRDNSTCSNLLVRYNTFLDDGVISECPGTNVKYHSNIFEDFTSFTGSCSQPVGDFDYNVILDSAQAVTCGTHDKIVDDLGLAADGMHLAPGSEAIGAGNPSDIPSEDYDDDDRPQGLLPDAGADEWVAPSSLVGAWGFNETSGSTANDSSQYDNDGSVSGAAWSTLGKSGGAISFDGLDDLVTVADANELDLTTGMTLEAWVYPTEIGGWRTVVMKEQTNQLTWALYADKGGGDGSSAHAYTTSNKLVDTDQNLTLNTWVHLAATYDGEDLRIYVNGVEVDCTSNISGSMVTSSGAVRIGGNNVWGEWFEGRLDDVRIWNVARTEAEIQSDLATPVW